MEIRLDTILKRISFNSVKLNTIQINLTFKDNSTAKIFYISK